VHLAGQTPLNLAGIETQGACPSLGLPRNHRLGGGPPAFRALLDELKIAAEERDGTGPGRSGTIASRLVFQCWCARAMCWADERW